MTGPAPALTAGAFADPPSTVRPKYRWWMPMAFTEDEQLRVELADMKAIGAGGAEVATTTATGPRASAPDFLAEYGWGSPLWARKVQMMAETARAAYLDLGTVVDTATVTVNGTALPALDPQDLRHIEVGHLLRPGENTMTVRVASTLLNAVRVAPGTGAADRERMDYGLLGPVRLTPVEARQPTLSVEALERELPLAVGGANQSRIRIANNSPSPVVVSVDVMAGEGVEAVPVQRSLRIPGGSAVTTQVRLRGGNEAGSSDLVVDVVASNGAHGQAYVALRHSDDLALDATVAPTRVSGHRATSINTRRRS